MRGDTGRRVGIADASEGRGTAAIVRVAAGRAGWRELPHVHGAPAWELAGGGRITYEPGAQLEIGSPVFAAPAPLAHYLADIVGALRDAAATEGVQLLLTGVDPENPIDAVPLALADARYSRMTRYFDAIGPAGRRMMRQTASLQVSVELGERPLDRWRLLNALAPYLVAAAANSRRYAGVDTGHASYRAHLWRTLDPSRTGLPWHAADPVGAYAEFAGRAGRILAGDTAHLTTLFPEVRPRGYFEIRSMDAVEPDRVARLLALIHAIVYEPAASAAALELLGAPDESLLVRAGELGSRDTLIAGRLRALERVAASSVGAA